MGYPKTVRRVTLVKDEAGVRTVQVVHSGKGRAKRQSWPLRPVDRALRRSVQAIESTTNSYLSRHRRSNRKRRDGWLLDLGQNLVKAHRRGLKRLKVDRILGL